MNFQQMKKRYKKMLTHLYYYVLYYIICKSLKFLDMENQVKRLINFQTAVSLEKALFSEEYLALSLLFNKLKINEGGSFFCVLL